LDEKSCSVYNIVVLLFCYTFLCTFKMLRPNLRVLAHCGTHAAVSFTCHFYAFLLMSIINCQLLILNVPKGMQFVPLCVHYRPVYAIVHHLLVALLSRVMLCCGIL